MPAFRKEVTSPCLTTCMGIGTPESIAWRKSITRIAALHNFSLIKKRGFQKKRGTLFHLRKKLYFRHQHTVPLTAQFNDKQPYPVYSHCSCDTMVQELTTVCLQLSIFFSSSSGKEAKPSFEARLGNKHTTGLGKVWSDFISFIQKLLIKSVIPNNTNTMP